MGCGVSSTQKRAKVIVDSNLEKLWAEIETPMPKDRSYSDNGLKIVRLVLCSTYPDFILERQTICRTVVPFLQKWCMERKIIFVFDDMSLPEELQTPKIVQLCLRIARKYVNDNMMPLFCGLYGDRIGPVVELDENAAFRNSIPGRLTLVEYMTANTAYRASNRYSLFLIRDQSFLRNIGSESRVQFSAINTSNLKRSAVLRQKLGDKMPHQVLPYPFNFQTSPDSKQPMALSEDNIKQMIHFYKEKLEKEFPNHASSFVAEAAEVSRKSKLQKEKEDQASFITEKLRTTVRSADFCSELLDPENFSNGLTVITASHGKGKTASALSLHDRINVLVRQGKLKSRNGITYKLFSHFVGVTGRSRSIDHYLRRLLTTIFGFQEATLPQHPHVCMELVHDKLQNPNSVPVVLIVDAFGKFNPADVEELVRWIPDTLSHSVKIFLFLESKSLVLELLRSKKHAKEILLPPLHIDAKRKMIQRYCQEISRAGKDVSEKTIQVLLKDEQILENIDDPVKLKIMLNLSASSGPDRLIALSSIPLEAVLDDQLAAFEQTPMFGVHIITVLCIFCAVRRGLTQSELRKLLSEAETLLTPELERKVLANDTAEKLQHVPSILMEGVLKELFPFLTKRENRLWLEDGQLTHYLRDKYLSNQDMKHWWHGKLADLFESPDMCFVEGRKAFELPTHCIHLGDKDRLRRALCDWEVIEGQFKRQYSWELLKYWSQNLGGFKEMENVYMELVQKEFETDPEDVNIEEMSHKCTQIAYILKQASLHESALVVVQKLVDAELSHGARPPRLGRFCFMQAELMEKKIMTGEFPIRTIEPKYAEKIPDVVQVFQKALENWNKAVIHDENLRKVMIIKCNFHLATLHGWAFRHSGGKLIESQAAAIGCIENAEEAMSAGSKSELIELQAMLCYVNSYMDFSADNIKWKKKAVDFAIQVFGEQSYTVWRLQKAFGVEINGGAIYQSSPDTLSPIFSTRNQQPNNIVPTYSHMGQYLPKSTMEPSRRPNAEVAGSVPRITTTTVTFKPNRNTTTKQPTSRVSAAEQRTRDI